MLLVVLLPLLWRLIAASPLPSFAPSLSVQASGIANKYTVSWSVPVIKRIRTVLMYSEVRDVAATPGLSRICEAEESALQVLADVSLRCPQRFSSMRLLLNDALNIVLI